MSNLPKASLVSSSWLTASWSKTSALFRRWSGKILLVLGAATLSTSALWCTLQITACRDRVMAKCHAIGNKRIEIERFSRGDSYIRYYVLESATKELVEHELDYAKVLIDVPSTEKPYIITSTYWTEVGCNISADVHLRSAEEVEHN